MQIEERMTTLDDIKIDKIDEMSLLVDFQKKEHTPTTQHQQQQPAKRKKNKLWKKEREKI